ncbi:conserved hypothetical protein [Gammaproteobacteria bacterium]
MNKLITSSIAFLTLVGILFGAYSYVDNRYALSDTVKQIEQRLDYKIVSDQVNETQNRIWQLQDRYVGKTTPRVVEEQIRELQYKIDSLKEKMKSLERKAEPLP